LLSSDVNCVHGAERRDGEKMSKLVRYLVMGLFLFLVPASALAADDLAYDLGSRAATVGMDLLNVESGSDQVLALTNAGHARIAGETTQRALSGVTDVSGLRQGDGNLLVVNRPDYRPLWFFFYNTETGLAVYMEPDPEFIEKNVTERRTLPADKAFSQVSLMVVSLDAMLASPDDAGTIFARKKFGGNEFSLIGLSNVWAAGAPFDFMQAAAFHDHLCPGVTSGYMITRYVEKVLPVTNRTAETYVDIGSPNWCKEDAFQMIWDATPGKNSMVVMALSPEDEAALKEKYGTRPAGIIIRWNDAAQKGTGVALGFDFDKVSEELGLVNFTGPSWAPKLVQDIGMMPYLEHPESVITTLKEFTVDEEIMTSLRTAGNNPYRVLGML